MAAVVVPRWVQGKSWFPWADVQHMGQVWGLWGVKSLGRWMSFASVFQDAHDLWVAGAGLVLDWSCHCPSPRGWEGRGDESTQSLLYLLAEPELGSLVSPFTQFPAPTQAWGMSLGLSNRC